MGTYVVDSGQVVSGVVLSFGTSQVVSSGGTAVGTVVFADTVQTVLAGGFADGTILVSEGWQEVYGTAFRTVVSDSFLKQHVKSGGTAVSTALTGGDLVVSSGGHAVGTVVDGGDVTVCYGGYIWNAQLHHGRIIYDGGVSGIGSGQSASGVSLSAGSQHAVGFGGHVAEIKVRSGGLLTVHREGKASGAVVSSGGLLTVSSGGTALGITQKTGGMISTVVAPGTFVSGSSAGGEAFRISGGTASGFTLLSGNQQLVVSGGVASGTTVSSGGRLTVSSGGTALGVVQQAGGSVHVDIVPGTLVSGVNAKGSALLLSGGTASGFLLGECERQTVSSGVTIIGTTVSSGARQDVSSGGTASGTVVFSEGNQSVLSGGTASGTVVSSGGMLTVFAGGTALGAVQETGGRMCIDVALSDTLFSGVNAEGGSMMLSGGTASGFILYSDDSMTIGSGIAAIDTVISSGGLQKVWAGATSGTKILSGGGQYVGIDEELSWWWAEEYPTSSGTAFGTVVSSGGTLGVGGHGSAIGVVQRSGGNVNVAMHSGAVVSGVNAEGGRLLLSGGTASGFILYSGGSMAVHSGCMASGTVVSSGGLQEIWDGTAVGTVVRFGGEQRALYAEAMLLRSIVSSGGTQTIMNFACASGTKVFSGALQIVGRTSDWDDGDYGGKGSSIRAVLLPGGRQRIAEDGEDFNTVVSSGAVQRVFSRGSAVSTVVSAGGSQVVSSGGTASGASILSGGMFYALRGAKVSALTLSSGGSAILRGGAVLGGRTAAQGAVLYVSSTGTRFRAMSTDAMTAISFDVRSVSAGSSKSMLTAAAPAILSGSFAVQASALQPAGSWRLMEQASLAKGTPFAVSAGSSAVGRAVLNGSAVSAGGMAWRVKASGGNVTLTAAAVAGKMKHGTASADKLAGSENCDVFWGGGGNDRINGYGGRDCAVYGKEAWGQDVIVKTSGTMALVFNGLKSSQVTSSLSGSTMTFAKKADAAQKITVSGWSAGTHSVVFGGTMKDFDAWAKAASPTAAQAKAARQEVWKTAGLAG